MSRQAASSVNEPHAVARSRIQLVLRTPICVAALFMSSAHANLAPAPLTGVATEVSGADRPAPRADRFDPLRVAPHACGAGGCMKLGQDATSLKQPTAGTALPEPILVAPTCGSHCTRTRSSGTTLPEPPILVAPILVAPTCGSKCERLTPLGSTLPEPILVAPGACASGGCGKSARAASSTAWPTAV